MSVARGLKHCMRVLRRSGLLRLPRDLRGVTNAVDFQQQRNFKDESPHHYSWPTKRGEDANEQVNSIYGEEKGFDPRYDERHYLSHYRDDQREAETRRRITQDTLDHQRRQERIIEDNKRRWLQRAEPKSTMPGQYSYDQPVFGPKQPRKSNKQDDKSAEDYSRRRRRQRQKEVKRQERELRESRKGYDLPKSEMEDSTTDKTAMPDTSLVSKAWLEKHAREAEAKYWHTWTTCPDERQQRGTGRDDEPRAEAESGVEEDDSAAGYKPDQRRGFVKPTLPYDSSVRRFQTHSQQMADRAMNAILPPQYVPDNHNANDTDASASASASANAISIINANAHAKAKAKAKGNVQASTVAVAGSVSKAERRRPSGMEKQYLLARDIDRLHALSDERDAKRTTSLLQTHVFKSPASLYSFRPKTDQLEDIELPEQPRRCKQAWRGIPRPVFKRLNGINRAIARNSPTGNTQRQKPARCVRPPIRLPLRSSIFGRKRTPIDSFSNMLIVNTHYTPHSEYTGYGRQTVCDAWQSFTNSHNVKPIN